MAAACAASIHDEGRTIEVRMRSRRAHDGRKTKGRVENREEDETQAVKTNKLPLQTSRA